MESYRPLYRGHPNKLIAGVCAGIAARLGWEPIFVRAAFGIFGLLSLGLVFWGYIVLWLLIPETAGQPSLAERFIAKTKTFFEPRRPPSGPSEGSVSPSP